MELEVSTKSSVGVKPHIRKGYYPGRLTKVEPYNDKDGNPKEGKHGRMLIFTFTVFKHDGDGKPISPMEYVPDPDCPNITKDVEIPRFVYYMYKDKQTQELQTAVTPKGAITLLLKALGWTFSPEPVDPSSFIGNWVELNVDDFQAGDEGAKYSASTIKDVKEYTGKPIDDTVKMSSPKEVDSQEVVEESIDPPKEKTSPSTPEEVKAQKTKELDRLLEEGTLTKEAHTKAFAQLNA